MKKRDLTMSRRIAKLLLDGRSRTAQEIAVEFNLTQTQATDALILLRETHRIAAIPASYRLTALGTKFATHVPKSRALMKRELRAKQAAKRAAAVIDLDSDDLDNFPRTAAAAIVANAIASRPALQRAWGAAWFADREVA
jgi:hypothetical protein